MELHDQSNLSLLLLYILIKKYIIIPQISSKKHSYMYRRIPKNVFLMHSSPHLHRWRMCFSLQGWYSTSRYGIHTISSNWYISSYFINYSKYIIRRGRTANYLYVCFISMFLSLLPSSLHKIRVHPRGRFKSIKHGIPCSEAEH